MANSTPTGGGIFLVIAIFGGFALGLAFGAPLIGAVIGTIIGIAAATLIWLRDRRRGG